jgi:hypothetical protein
MAMAQNWREGCSEGWQATLNSLCTPSAALLGGAAAKMTVTDAQTDAQTCPSHHVPEGSQGWFKPRFDNPWPTWKGDKTFGEIRQWMAEKHALGAPDHGHLLNNRTPTLEQLRWAAPPAGGGACAPGPCPATGRPPPCR